MGSKFSKSPSLIDKSTLATYTFTFFYVFVYMYVSIYLYIYKSINVYIYDFYVFDIFRPVSALAMYNSILPPVKSYCHKLGFIAHPSVGDLSGIF